MAEGAAEAGHNSQAEDTELQLAVHRFSNEAFSLAKEYVTGKDPEGVKSRARDLEARVPEFGARAQTAPPEIRPDLNRVLSDARLDLAYILADGNRPSSTRLHYFLSDQKQS
jgi:hypothetical protein